MKFYRVNCLLILLAASLCTSVMAQNEGGLYIKPHLSWSSLSNDSLIIEGISGKAKYDTGFATGFGFGHDYGNGFRSELDFEYRTNEYSSVDLGANGQLTGGDFSSAILYLNAYYHFDTDLPITPFVGVGLGWVQEIDFDATANGAEQSYSESGDWAYQLILGAEYQLSDAWHLQGNIRSVNINSLKLKEEGGDGRIADADYGIWSAGLGLVYRF